MATAIFRVDGSREIGAGHIMRCLVLAEELRRTGADVFFVCRKMSGDFSDVIEKKSFRVFVLPMLPSNNPMEHKLENSFSQ